MKKRHLEITAMKSPHQKIRCGDFRTHGLA